MLGEDWEVEHLAQELAHSRLSINGSSDEDECTFPTDIYWVPFKGQAVPWALGNYHRQ